MPDEKVHCKRLVTFLQLNCNSFVTPCQCFFETIL